MNLEQLVISLELAQELKENGYPQEGTQFWWVRDDSAEQRLQPWYSLVFRGQYKDLGFEVSTERYAAPTASEILDRFPSYVRFEKASLPFKLYIEKEIQDVDSNEYNVFYVRHSKTLLSEKDYQERGRSFGENLADAAAKMYLYLKKNNLLGGK